MNFLPNPVWTVSNDRVVDRVGQSHELQVLMEHLPFDVWVRDRDQCCVYANAAAQRHFPGLVGRTPDQTDADPAAIAVWKANNARAYAGEIVVGDVEYGAGATRRIVRNYIAPVIRDGQVVGTVGVNVDITAQRQAEAAAVGDQAIVSAMFDAAQLALGVREIDGSDLIHLADNRASVLFHGGAPVPVGTRDSALGVPREAREEAIRVARRSARQGQPVAFESTRQVAGQGTRVYRGTVAAIDPAATGGAERFLFAAEDVTEQRSLETELLRSERLASMGTLAAGVAHEIKNPAMVASLCLDRLRDKLEGAAALSARERAQLLEVVADAEAATSQISRLVRDLSKLADPHDDRMDAVQLDEVVANAVGLARVKVLRDAELSLELSQPPLVLGNAVRLAQVVINLMFNAAQALSGAGRRGQITVRTTRFDDRARLEIEDDGPGIDSAIIGRLFQPFATGSTGGTGLGLWVCRQIVEAHHGTISAEARPGGGTTMRVDLPLAPGAG